MASPFDIPKVPNNAPDNSGNGFPERDPLERLNHDLYSSDAVPVYRPAPLPEHPEYRTPNSQIPEAWEPPPPPPPPKPKNKGIRGFSWVVWFLIGSVAFCVLAGGLSFLFLFMGGRDVSSDKILITVQGSNTISSGTAVPLTITVQNKNPAAIQNATITLTFPDGTRMASDMTQPLTLYTQDLGTMQPGTSDTRTVQAVFFGNTNQTLTVPITIQYTTANSNAQFTKKQNYTLTITSSPLTITAKTVPSASPGEPITIALAVRSNSQSALNNLAVAAQYPSGFMPQKTGTSTNFFQIGTLQPGQEKDLNIIGTLSGSQNATSSFNFTVGTIKGDGSPTLGVAYASQSTTVTLTKAFLSADISINHSDTDPVVVQAGQQISGFLTWVNTTASAINNAQITLLFSGNALNPNSVSAGDGFYDSAHHTLIFNNTTNPNLTSLQPSGTDSSSFNFTTKTSSQLASLKNPTAQIAVSVTGQAAGEPSPRTITNTLIRTIKVATDFEMRSSIVHTTGPFTNSGPWPPKVNTPTTYTVLLKVTNTVNDVAGATATMILPPYVTWTGEQSASVGALSYDNSTHTVTWEIGAVPAGTTTNAPITAAFQISFLPSVTQVGQSPTLIENQTLAGTDRFTDAQVGTTQSSLTTETTTDPQYRAQFGEVSN